MRLDSIIANTHYEPREYQKRIIVKTTDMFGGRYKTMDGNTNPPAKSVMIESPTGSGKTCISLLTAKKLQHEVPNLAIGWVAMRRNLLKQAKKENDEKQVNLENIHYISMFEDNPKKIIEHRKSGGKVLLVLDECLAGETLVDILVDGKPAIAPISDVVENGIGTHVLSYDVETETVEWSEIESRTATGEKQVYEIGIETDSGEVITILATENHRFFTTANGPNGGYKRVDELCLFDDVLIKNHVVERSDKQDGQHEFRQKAVG